MSTLPTEIADVLGRADFCHVATLIPSGPHATPLVFAVAGDRLWVTTSRGSVKARGWARNPRVAGVARHGREAVAFIAEATAYDVLDPDSWARSVRRTPLLALASLRFTRKNARFFAGYAIDARHVPLAWTPPGRVFAELRVVRSALIRDGVVVRSWGRWARSVPSHERFRAVRTGDGPLEALPDEIREGLGQRGEGVLAIEGERGVIALPSTWVVSGAGLYAVPAEQTLALAGLDAPSVRVALAMDRQSWWRARNMLGAMARGRGDVFVVAGLASGGRSASAVAGDAGAAPTGAAVVRVSPDRLVWWRGWTSGTVSSR